jgi:hypothetical protein
MGKLNKPILVQDKELMDLYHSGMDTELLAKAFAVTPEYIIKLIKGQDITPDQEAQFLKDSLVEGRRVYNKGTSLLLRCYNIIETKINKEANYLTPSDLSKLVTAISNSQIAIGKNIAQLNMNQPVNAESSLHNAKKESKEALKQLAENTVIGAG